MPKHEMSIYEDAYKLEADSRQASITEPKTSYNGVAFTEHDVKMARLRVDFFLVGTLTLYYFCNFLDRSNLGNAKVAGMPTELNMQGNDYNVAVSIYYVAYVTLEWPFTIMLKRIGPNRLLPTLVTLWGLVTMCQGWIKNYSGLLATRFILGMLEACLTPSSMVLLAMYIRRFDLQKRLAVFYAMISLAGAFSGLIAYGITEHLNNAHGYSGWRWIFLLEGAGTMVVGLLSYFTIPHSPMKAWWLSERQKAGLLCRLEEDNMAYVEAHEETGMFASLNVLWTNPQAIPFIFLCMCSGFFTGGLSYFIPPIVEGLGYTAVRAQLFTVPPYACAFVMAIFFSVLGDHYRLRSPVVWFAGLLGILGYIILFTQLHNNPVRLGAIFLIVTGGGIISAATNSWTICNTSGHLRRTSTIVLGISASGAVALASTWSFKPEQAPQYIAASSVGTAAAAGLFVVAPLHTLNLWRINKKRDRQLAAMPTDHQWPKDAVMDDRDVRFRFTY